MMLIMFRWWGWWLCLDDEDLIMFRWGGWWLCLDDEDDDYDCDPGDYPSMESEMSVPSPESSLSPRPSSLAESMQV